MPMTKKDYCALADAIRVHNKLKGILAGFTESQISDLADALQQVNHRFNRDRWLKYIANGPAKAPAKRGDA